MKSLDKAIMIEMQVIFRTTSQIQRDYFINFSAVLLIDRYRKSEYSFCLRVGKATRYELI